jgi:hypothetical protein
VQTHGTVETFDIVDDVKRITAKAGDALRAAWIEQGRDDKPAVDAMTGLSSRPCSIHEPARRAGVTGVMPQRASTWIGLRSTSAAPLLRFEPVSSVVSLP